MTKTAKQIFTEERDAITRICLSCPATKKCDAWCVHHRRFTELTTLITK